MVFNPSLLEIFLENTTEHILKRKAIDRVNDINTRHKT